MSSRTCSNLKLNIDDLSISDLNSYQFDLAIFSSGYEPRCAYVYNYLDKSRIIDGVILSYSESINLETNDYFSNADISYTRLKISHSEVSEIYDYLLVFLPSLIESKEVINILIDYSTMSRNWYSAIINFIFYICPEKINIFTVYSSAEYPLLKSDSFFDFELGEVRVIPGCSGSSITKKKKAVIFMLGFDSIGPQSFYNLIEPDEAFGVIASPGALPSYEEIALDINKSFIDHNLSGGDRLIKLPMDSVRYTFENLCQLIQPLRKEYNVTIIQFGPKPHILASVLAGHIFENVSCIYSEYKRNRVYDVHANGDLIISKISARY